MVERATAFEKSVLAVSPDEVRIYRLQRREVANEMPKDVYRAKIRLQVEQLTKPRAQYAEPVIMPTELDLASPGVLLKSESEKALGST